MCSPLWQRRLLAKSKAPRPLRRRPGAKERGSPRPTLPPATCLGGHGGRGCGWGSWCWRGTSPGRRCGVVLVGDEQLVESPCHREGQGDWPFIPGPGGGQEQEGRQAQGREGQAGLQAGSQSGSWQEPHLQPPSREALEGQLLHVAQEDFAGGVRLQEPRHGSKMARRRQKSKPVPSKNRMPIKTTRRVLGTPATKPMPTPLTQGTTLAAAQEDSVPSGAATVDDLACDSERVVAPADAQKVAADTLAIFTVEETDGESSSSNSSEEEPPSYTAGSTAYVAIQRRLGTIVGSFVAPAPPQSLMAAACRRAEPDIISLIWRRPLQPWIRLRRSHTSTSGRGFPDEGVQLRRRTADRTALPLP
jgi:hypothetical protein